jgi:hypothetical protein
LENETNIFLVPDFDQENVTSLAIVKNVFDTSSKQISSRILSNAQTLGIDFISSMEFINQFTYSTLRNSVGEFSIPKINTISFSTKVTAYNMSLIVQDLSLSNEGTVFMIVQPFMETVSDPENEGRLKNITLNYIIKPSPAQVLNCLNHLNVKVPNCARAVYIGKNISIQFWDGIKNNTYYKLHYVVTNQSPMEPVMDGSVQEMETVSMLLGLERLLFSFVGMLAVLMSILFVIM